MYLRTFAQPLLEDPALQEALQANARRRKAAWTRAMASLSVPWEEARARLQAIREHVLTHWDAVLDAFLAQVQANGVHVHRAADAAAARAIVLDLAHQYAARLVVKSKSMLTEEIGLNDALEAHGVQVVETDLGEFIVQLRGEKPAHIITPAVHLRRQDVGRTFHERLGVPYTEDIAEMTQVARRTLRQLFLEADMGISGVNFGVVETGTLVVVTNEGNGRMVTTLPKVHVAVMGMERLISTLAELAWGLRLLPRAATGQMLTVYVSLLHGPRGPHDPDGPEARHLILVDNGRTHLARTPLRDILRCIRCGACLNACPVFAHLGGHGYRAADGTFTPYTGPMGIVLSAGLFGKAFAGLAYLCTLCGACAEVCPVGIPLPDLILEVRRGAASSGPLPQVPTLWQAGLRLYTEVARHPHLFRLGQKVLRGALPLVAKMVPAPFLQGAILEDVSLPEPSPGEAEEPLAPADLQASAAPDDPVARFIARAQSVDVEVHRVPQTHLAEAVIRWCRENGVTTLWPWDAGALPQGLLEALQVQGLTFAEGPQVPVGLTAAAAAIAETGTLVVPSGPGRPLGASLLPEAHLAVVPEDAVVATLEDALRAETIRRGPATVLITGPSRTADIEMTLTLGVHGPGRVVVFLTHRA